MENLDLKKELVSLLKIPVKALGRICKGAYRAGVDGPSALNDIVGGAITIILWPILVGPKFIRLLIQMKNQGKTNNSQEFQAFAPSSSTNIFDTSDKETKPSSKKGLFIAISIVLGATVVALILYSLPTQTKNSKPNNNSMSEIDISDSRDSKAAEAKAAAKASVKSFTDSRDGKAYKTVTIGKQTWMAENLNYDTKGGKCHSDNPENCKKYGRLYNWTAAKKACPTGWHLPSNAEWDALYRLVDGTNGEQSPYKSETAGKYLKAASGWNSQNEKSGNGEDAYSFAALPGGSGRAGTFHLLGDNGYWWSSTESDKNAYYRFMLYESDVAGWNSNSKTLLLSVRCVKD